MGGRRAARGFAGGARGWRRGRGGAWGGAWGGGLARCGQRGCSRVGAGGPGKRKCCCGCWPTGLGLKLSLLGVQTWMSVVLERDANFGHSLPSTVEAPTCTGPEARIGVSIRLDSAWGSTPSVRDACTGELASWKLHVWSAIGLCPTQVLGRGSCKDLSESSVGQRHAALDCLALSECPVDA